MYIQNRYWILLVRVILSHFVSAVFAFLKSLELLFAYQDSLEYRNF